MLSDNIFAGEEIPTLEIYEAAHTVMYDYMEKRRCKIDVVAAELGTTRAVLYRQLNPNDTLMPLSIDRCIAITKLTGDMRLLEEFAKIFECVAIPKKQSQPNISDINLLVDFANIENNDVFKVVKNAIADNMITDEEKKQILKEIDEAEKANAKLKDIVLHTATKEMEETNEY